MAIDASVREILDPRTLTASYQQMAGLAPVPIQEQFIRADAEQVDDNQVRSFYDPADVTPAPGNNFGASARVLSMGDAREQLFTLIYTFNAVEMPEIVFQAIRDPEGYYLQQKGVKEVARIIGKFRNRLLRFRELVTAKVLTVGKIYMDGAGQVLESSSGAVTTYDYNVPSANQGNIGGIIDLQWTDPTADIPRQIELLDDLSVRNNVPACTDVWMNKANLGYLRNNNAFREWAKRNEAAQTVILNGGMIENLWGKTWHFYNHVYKSAAGTNTAFIPKTGTGSVVFTPPPTDPWVKAVLGKTMIPKSFEPVADPGTALDNIDSVFGPFAYALVKHDPVMLVTYLGDKFGLFFNESKAIYQAACF